MITDALENPIIVGINYGYSTTSSGVNTVTTGKAIGNKGKGVTLEIISCKSVYGTEGPLQDVQMKVKKVNVMGIRLFPIT